MYEYINKYIYIYVNNYLQMNRPLGARRVATGRQVAVTARLPPLPRPRLEAKRKGTPRPSPWCAFACPHSARRQVVKRPKQVCAPTAANAAGIGHPHSPTEERQEAR